MSENELTITVIIIIEAVHLIKIRPERILAVKEVTHL